MATTSTTVNQRSNNQGLVTWLARFRELRIVLFLIAIVLLVTAVQPRFFSLFNLRSILLWVPLLTVVAMGEMMVIITRGIDISIGSILGFAGIAVGMIFRDNPGFNIYLAAVLGILIGMVLGAFNGALVAWVKVPPIIATLGTLSMYRGLTFVLSGGRQIDPNHVPSELIGWS